MQKINKLQMINTKLFLKKVMGLSTLISDTEENYLLGRM